MPKLTQTFVSESVKNPAQGQTFYRDTVVQGFGLRATPGSKSYIVEARVNGVVRRITLGKHGALNAMAARKKAKRLLAMMASGKDPVLEKAQKKLSGVTLQQVLDHYLSVRNVRPNTIKQYRYILPRCLGDWLNLPVAAITREMVQERHHNLKTRTRQGTTGEAQANAVMRLLGTLISFAAAQYEVHGQPIILVNPVKRLSQNRQWYPEYRRQVIIPDYKIADWIREVVCLRQPTVRDYLLTLFLTGLRRNEAATLRWEDVDLNSKVIKIRSEVSKNRQEHRLPLSDFLFELFRNRFETKGSSEFVFPGRNGITHIVDSDHVISGVAERIGHPFTLHDLRRNFLTAAEKLNLPYVVLKKLANHSGRNDTTFGYLIVDVERLRKPMQEITDHFFFLAKVRRDCKHF